jgi:hypothetical protein
MSSPNAGSHSARWRTPEARRGTLCGVTPMVRGHHCGRVRGQTRGRLVSRHLSGSRAPDLRCVKDS